MKVIEMYKTLAMVDKLIVIACTIFAVSCLLVMTDLYVKWIRATEQEETRRENRMRAVSRRLSYELRDGDSGRAPAWSKAPEYWRGRTGP